MGLLTSILQAGGGLIAGLFAQDAAGKQKKGIKKAGAVSAAASLEAGDIGAKAAKKASKVQVKAGRSAIDTIRKFGNKSIDAQQDYHEEAVGYLEPYRTVGQGAIYSLADLYGLPTEANPEGGQPLSDEALAAFERSPDYVFARDQAIKAHDRSAAAKGMLLSGGAARELAELSSGLASQNFSNYAARLLALSQMGEGAAGTSANAALTTGRGIGSTFEGMGSGIAAGKAGIGDVKAAGILGAANAKAGGLLGAAQAIAGAITGASEADAAGSVGFGNALGAGISDAFNGFNLNDYLKTATGGNVLSGAAAI